LIWWRIERRQQIEVRPRQQPLYLFVEERFCVAFSFFDAI
jgi:hypothetical protein